MICVAEGAEALGRDGNFRVESVAVLPWNQWQVCCGISGKFAVESVATLHRNQWQVCRGIGGNFRVEYARRSYTGQTAHMFQIHLALNIKCPHRRLHVVIHNMRIDHRGRNVFMAEQLLNRANVVAAVEQVHSKRVTKRMWRRRLGDARCSQRIAKRPLDRLWIDMMAPDSAAARVRREPV